MSEEFDGIGSFHSRSEPCASLFEALAAAQAKFEGADRDAVNPHFRSKYATLASVIEASRDALAANKLCIIQIPGNLGDNIAVTTILGHASGEWIESTIYVAPVKFDAQGLGSVVSYLRRYARMAILGIAPEDDDGEAAVARPAQMPLTATKANPAVQTADKELARRAYMQLKAAVDRASDPEAARAIWDGGWSPPYQADARLVGQVSLPSLVDLERRLQQASGRIPTSPEPPEEPGVPAAAPPGEPRRRRVPRKRPEPTEAEIETVLGPEPAELDPAPIEEPPEFDPTDLAPLDGVPPASVYVPFDAAAGNPREWFVRARERVRQMQSASSPPHQFVAFRKANFAPLLRLKEEYFGNWQQIDGLIKMGEQ